jgi:hypothetical protein
MGGGGYDVTLWATKNTCCNPFHTRDKSKAERMEFQSDTSQKLLEKEMKRNKSEWNSSCLLLIDPVTYSPPFCHLTTIGKTTTPKTIGQCKVHLFSLFSLLKKKKRE